MKWQNYPFISKFVYTFVDIIIINFADRHELKAVYIDFQKLSLMKYHKFSLFMLKIYSKDCYANTVNIFVN